MSMNTCSGSFPAFINPLSLQLVGIESRPGEGRDCRILKMPYKLRQQLKRLTLGATEPDSEIEEQARLKVIANMTVYEKSIYNVEAALIQAYKTAELIYSRMLAAGVKKGDSPCPPACPMHEEVDRRTVSVVTKAFCRAQ